MAKFKAIEVFNPAHEGYCARQSAVIEVRRYRKDSKRFTVELHNGWGDRPKIRFTQFKHEAKKIVRDYFESK